MCSVYRDGDFALMDVVGQDDTDCNCDEFCGSNCECICHL